MNDEIVKQLKKNNLDNALLFFTSSFGIVFGFFQVLLGDIDVLIFFIPLYLLGWFMPMYIGYIRGNLVFDSTYERVRGWIYYYESLFLYASYVCIYWALFSSDFHEFIKIIIGILWINLVLLANKYRRKLIESIYIICCENLSRKELERLEKFSWGPISLALGSYMLLLIVGFNLNLSDYSFIGYTLIILPLFFISLFYEYEYRKRRIIFDPYNLNRTEEEYYQMYKIPKIYHYICYLLHIIGIGVIVILYDF